MRNALLFGLAVVLAACGGPARSVTKTPGPPAVAPPPPPPFQIALSPSIGTFVADATHLYWADDDAIYRRPLGPDQQAERLFAAGYVSALAPGSKELFFLDEDYQLRAMPLTGGQARVVDTPGEAPWGIYAEGDAVWYALGEQLIGITPSGRRTIDVPGAHMVPFTGGDGAVYVVRYGDDDLYHLERFDLASATARTVSRADFLSDAQALALVGGEIAVLVSDGVILVPLDGGEAHRAFYGGATGLAADARGYAAGGYGFVVTHVRKQAPRIVDAGSADHSVTSINAMAVAGEYVYYTATTNDSGEVALRAAARDSGPTLLRLPLDAGVSAVAAVEGAVYAGVETEIGTAIFQVGTRKAKPIAPSGWIEQLVASDEWIVALADGWLQGRPREGGDQLTTIGETYSQVVIHKGKVYWNEGAIIRAATLPDGEPFDVIDISTFDPAWIDVSNGTLAFANEHLFFVVNAGDRQGIAQLDEQRQITWLWTWTQAPDAYLSLDPNLVAIGDALFVHDGESIYRVSATDGTSSRVFSGQTPDDESVTYSVAQLYAGGDHLLAKLYGEGEELVEIPLEGGEPRRVWSTTLDGSYLSYISVAPDAAYVHVSELISIVKIPLE